MATLFAPVVASAFGLSAATALAVTQIAIGLAASALSRSRQRQNVSAERRGAAQRSRSQGGALPQSIVLGRTATAGSDLFAPYAYDGGVGDLSGPPLPSDETGSGRFLTLGIALSDIPVSALRAVIVQGVRFEWGTEVADQGNAVGWEPVAGLPAEKDRYRNKFRIRFHDGTQTAVDPFLNKAYGNHPTRPITSDMVYAGGAYALFTARLDQELWQNLRDIRFELDGAAVGPGDTFTQNPVRIANAIATGITLHDGDVFGLEYPEIDASSLASAAQAVDDAGFGAGLDVQIGSPDGNGADALDALGDFLDTCAGTVVEDGGALFFGALNDGLPVASITDDDLLHVETQNARSVTSLTELHNSVTITHPNPDAGWEFLPAPTFTDAAHVAEDGRALSEALTYPALNSSDQAQKLAEMYERDARRSRVHAIPLPMKWAYLRSMEKITWTSEFNGYSNKEFVIQDSRQRGHVVVLTVRETDPNDFDPGTTNPPPFVPVPPSTPALAPLVPDLAATASTRTFDDGRRRPVIDLTWSIAPQSATSIIIEVRVQGQAATETTTADVNALAVTWEAVGGVTYEARAIFTSDTREVAWSGWIAVTADDVRLEVADLSDQTQDIIDIALMNTAAIVQDVNLSPNGSQKWTRWEAEGIQQSAVANEVYTTGFTRGFVVTATQDDGIETRSDRSTWDGPTDLDAFFVEVDFTLVSGSLDGAGVIMAWVNDVGGSFEGAALLKDMTISGQSGQTQKASAVLQKPQNFTGTFKENRFYLVANWDNAPFAPRAGKEIKFHRGYVRAATPEEVGGGQLGASVEQLSGAVTDLEGNSAAAIVFRAKAGSAGSALELVAADDVESGPVSIARISADNILLDGIVTIEQSGAFLFGKTGPGDFANAGVYFGRYSATDFVFHAGTKDNFIRIDNTEGVILRNARFFLNSDTATSGQITTSGNVSLVGSDQFSGELSAGGGGGGGGGGAGDNDDGQDGFLGGDTVVQLRDGTSVIATWTAQGGAGGAGGDGNKPASQSPGGSGQQAAVGGGFSDGGDGGNGVGGAGGDGGLAGATIVIPPQDISGLSNPNLEITIGFGGSNGNAGAGANPGEDGAQGQFSYSTTGDADIEAGPIAMGSAASGFHDIIDGVPDSLPAFNPPNGLWVLQDVPLLTEITFGPGATSVLTVETDNSVIAFIASQVPTYRDQSKSRNIQYQFYPVGSG